MREIRAQQALDGVRTILDLDVAPQFPPDPRRGAESAADHHMEAFHGVAVVVDGDPAADQADVAELAVYLASPESSWLTGVAIPLDGGLSAY